MLSSDLRALLLSHRDNDVVSGHGQKKILGTHYDPTSDQVVLDLEDDDVAWSDDVIGHVKKLDRWLESRSDNTLANTVWYLQWRAHMAEILGADDSELRGRSDDDRTT